LLLSCPTSPSPKKTSVPPLPEAELGIRISELKDPVLTLSSYVNLGKSLHLSEPVSCYIKRGNKIDFHMAVVRMSAKACKPLTSLDAD
jgi:hypothetical protein